MRYMVCRVRGFSLGLEEKEEDRDQEETASQGTHSVPVLKSGDENLAVWITVRFAAY